MKGHEKRLQKAYRTIMKLDLFERLPEDLKNKQIEKTKRGK